jgi:hypothetical protein
MRIFNRHEVEIAAQPRDVGELIDSLSSEHDLLWPHFRWPAMRFDRPLSVGARGGHGPVGYFVEEYEPGARIRFRFQNTHPLTKGIEGYHELYMETLPGNRTRLIHVILGTIRGRALLLWPLIVRPLHDALIEDGLARAAKYFDATHPFPPLSLWVRLLRALATRARQRRGTHQAAEAHR